MNIYVKETGSRRTLKACVEPEFDFLSTEYTELYQRSGASAFQHPLWLHSIYAVLAPGLGAKAHIVTVREPTGGALVMTIPLVIQRSCGVSIVQPADFGVCDYNCIVAAPETMTELASDEALVQQIQCLLNAGDVLIFRKFREPENATKAILGPGALSRNENSSFQVELGGNDFAEWCRIRLKKRFRNGASRRLRKLRADHKSVDFVTFKMPDDIETAIRFIARHRSARFEDDILHKQAYLDFYLHYAQAGAATGDAVTSGLIVDGELISADFGIVANGAFHSILCAARLDAWGKYAPGLLGLMELVRKRYSLGEARFDLGIGPSRQKSDFAATERPLYNLTIPTSLRGRMVSLVYNYAKPLKTLLRRRFVSVR